MNLAKYTCMYTVKTKDVCNAQHRIRFHKGSMSLHFTVVDVLVYESLYFLALSIQFVFFLMLHLFIYFCFLRAAIKAYSIIRLTKLLTVPDRLNVGHLLWKTVDNN